ncbi:MAG TPA: hypothetical protein VGV60_12795 [Candidatus Polarisedimenticolia bacterium]|nr:hypothetical protein [Candidatus Polarisedimenticolia bacterium]
MAGASVLFWTLVGTTLLAGCTPGPAPAAATPRAQYEKANAEADAGRLDADDPGRPHR